VGEWFERFFDGLYARVLPSTFDDAATLRQARTVKRLLKLRRGQRVLDIPCGMGRLTIPLARMGMAMTGVDLTASYLRRARGRARQEGLDIRLVQSDMRDIESVEEFDAAFNWFGSFGYFSDEGNLAFCRRVFRALRPGGRFLVEGVNRSWLLAHFLARTEQILGGVHIVHRNRWDEKAGRVISTWTLTRGKVTERHTIRMRTFSGAEMRALLHAAGFREVRLFTHSPFGRFTRHSRRLIAVGTRPMGGRS
jgi:2-polyprenyl-3-methyl-5-hydroxy-6-metoxy-1,4-benzoquinol methylase